MPPLTKYVCIKKDPRGNEYIEYVYANSWAEAERKANAKGWKLTGQFVEEKN
jgi:hypothetical protein